MLGSEVYAEVVDRHVELGGDVAWIAGLFDTAYPPNDPRRQNRARSSPAVEIESQLDDEWPADRIVIVAQLAEELDRATLALALRVVPVQWWEERLGTTVRSVPKGGPSPTVDGSLLSGPLASLIAKRDAILGNSAPGAEPRTRRRWTVRCRSVIP